MVTQVRSWIDDGVAPESIGVAARTKALVASASRALEAAGFGTCTLDTAVTPSPGVRVGTMHRFKGLEFRCVAVVDADADTIPAPWDVTPASDDELQNRLDVQRERCLLYVACTRARDDL